MNASHVFPAVWVLTLIFAWIAPGSQAKTDQAANPQPAAIQDFDKRVAEYVKLHKKAESELPPLKPTNSAADIAAHQRALADRIRQARPSATQGDIFTQPIASEFRRLLATAVSGQKRRRVHQSLQHAEPVKAELHVNDAYPSKLPRQSTPPTILLNLPKLPPELRYRILDHDLLLVDSGANLIVDFVPNAIP